MTVTQTYSYEAHRHQHFLIHEIQVPTYMSVSFIKYEIKVITP